MKKGSFDLVVLALGSAMFVLFLVLQGVIIGEEDISAELEAQTSHSNQNFQAATAAAAISSMENPDVIKHANKWETYDSEKQDNILDGDGYDHNGLEEEVEQVLQSFAQGGDYEMSIEGRGAEFTVQNEPSTPPYTFETYIAAPDQPLRLIVGIQQ